MNMAEVSARSRDHGRWGRRTLTGIEAGADAYLNKPVVVRELAAVIRQQQRLIKIVSCCAQWRLDGPASRLHGPFSGMVELTQREYELLYLLYCSTNNSLERDQIEKSIWPDADRYDTGRLEVLVHRLRNKLTTHFGDGIKPLRTIRGYGYHFAAQLTLVQ